MGFRRGVVWFTAVMGRCAAYLGLLPLFRDSVSVPVPLSRSRCPRKLIFLYNNRPRNQNALCDNPEGRRFQVRNATVRSGQKEAELFHLQHTKLLRL
jgi:hypothetical protein